MLIGELAQRSGLSPSRIRFYESQGLIRVARRANGYRTYSPEALVALKVITTAQQAGFSLEDIRGFLLVGLSRWRHGPLLPALRKKVADIKDMQKRLLRTRAEIEALIANIEAKPEGMNCAQNTNWLLAQLGQAAVVESRRDQRLEGLERSPGHRSRNRQR